MLELVRKGLADPWALEIRLPESVISRAEARAIERALASRQPDPNNTLARLGIEVLR